MQLVGKTPTQQGDGIPVVGETPTLRGDGIPAVGETPTLGATAFLSSARRRRYG